MIRDFSPISQALIGTLFTWALTAAGAALVVVIRGKQRKLLDVSLGFAGGVMIAASYWSLLEPAIEMAQKSKLYGADGEYACIPVAIGFIIGAAFVYGTDVLVSALGIQSPNVLLAMQSVGTKQRRKIHEKSDEDLDDSNVISGVQISSGKNHYDTTTIDGFYEQNTRRRQPGSLSRASEVGDLGIVYEDPGNEAKNNQWRRIVLLVVAITVHNIPEGLAVGVGFGAVGSSLSATFESARCKLNSCINSSERFQGTTYENFPDESDFDNDQSNCENSETGWPPSNVDDHAWQKNVPDDSSLSNCPPSWNDWEWDELNHTERDEMPDFGPSDRDEMQATDSESERSETGDSVDTDQLQDGYPIDVLIRTLLIMATKIRHNLTWAASEDIVKMMNVLANSRTATEAKHQWKKILDTYANYMTIHHSCNVCNHHIGPQRGNLDEKLDCHHCGSQTDAKQNFKDGNVFIYLSLSAQLKHILETCEHHVIDPSNREKRFSIDDIYDGKLYKKNYIRDMLSINFSVDGTPVFESSNFSIYPILCTLNELGPEQRRSRVMLVSLWFGKGKPKLMNEFMKPFVEECKILFHEGFSYERGGISFTKRVRVLVGVIDSVARPTLRNSSQFNGEYGCGLCLHPGEYVPRLRGHTRVYPVSSEGNPFGEGLRNHADTLNHAERSEKGMKGRSILCDIPGFDIVKNLDVDWPHAVALGVTRQFGKLWFASKNSGHPFYFGHLLPNIDCILMSFKPSLDISRTPRKMSERTYWKAHEWVTWLLCYSLPTIESAGFSQKYVNHWSLLVDGIYILLKKSIKKVEIEYARKCFLKFVQGIESLYGKEHISFNVHLLLHLPESVLNWGPLWTHSSFRYEDYNQILLSYVKSSNGVALQVCSTFRISTTISHLERICMDHLTCKQKKYLYRVLNKKYLPKSVLLVDDVHMVGKSTPIHQLPREDFLALQRINVNTIQAQLIRYYNRVIMHNRVIHSMAYARVKKRNSYTVLLCNGEIFEIKRFVVVKIDNAEHCYAIGKYFERILRPLVAHRELKHLIVLNRIDDGWAAIPITAIDEKVVILESSHLNTIVAYVRPNHYELLT